VNKEASERVVRILFAAGAFVVDVVCVYGHSLHYGSLCCRSDCLGRVAAKHELDVRLGMHAYTPNLMYVTMFGSVEPVGKYLIFAPKRISVTS